MRLMIQEYKKKIVEDGYDRHSFGVSFGGTYSYTYGVQRTTPPNFIILSITKNIWSF